MRLSRYLLRLDFVTAVSRLIILILILFLHFLLSPLFVSDQIADYDVLLLAFKFRIMFRTLVVLDTLFVRVFFLSIL